MDTHMHSSFSLDSKMKMEAAVKKCIDNGYKFASFTEHLDIDFPGYGDKFSFDTECFLTKTPELNAQYAKKIEIIPGLEAGVTKETAQEIKEYIKKYDFEYVVLSNHLIFNEDPYADPDVYNRYPKNHVYSQYLSDIYEYMDIVEDFDTLGHYDYITRYANYDDPNLKYEDFKTEFDNILRYLSENNKSLEINTATYCEKKYGYRYFDIDILYRLKELGGSVTIGSDAHDTGFIGYRFDYFIDLIKKAGFDHLIYYKNREKNIIHI